MEHTPRYLVMVTGQANHNKYYKMIPKGNDSFDAEFGRVGAGCQTRSYRMSVWDKKYKEKIAKGYVDRTDLVEELIVREKSKTELQYREIENRSIREIVDRLQAMARKAVDDNYTISSSSVTMAMVEEAQKVLSGLLNCQDVETFNQNLLELYGVIPRKMSNVSWYMAKKKEDFGEIIEREQDLLDVMKGQVYVPPKKTVVLDDESTLRQNTILEEKGLVFEEVTEQDIKKIKSCLGSCSDKFRRAWRVTNLQTQKQFDEFTKDGLTTKLLWHGSRNENWWSIVSSGLVLRPTNAVITGKMFGYGIYFATKARKSLGYTSLHGSYWAGGHESSAFMGLYEVAYGKPYDVHSFDPKYYNFNYESLQKVCPGASCLHAHEGKMLRNDEIIVYQSCQTTIKYLVELQ